MALLPQGETQRELLSIFTCIVDKALLCAMIICNFYQNENEVGLNTRVNADISMQKRQNEDFNCLCVGCDRLARVLLGGVRWS